jgi:hypothetical protein
MIKKLLSIRVALPVGVYAYHTYSIDGAGQSVGLELLELDTELGCVRVIVRGQEFWTPLSNCVELRFDREAPKVKKAA